MRPRTRRIAGAGLVLTLGVAMTGCDAVYATRARVARPAADAAPEQVTEAFLRALSAKDWDTAMALVPPGNAFEREVADSWMTETWSLRSITVDRRSYDPGDDVNGGADTEFAEVRAEFDPHWLPWVNPGRSRDGPGAADPLRRPRPCGTGAAVAGGRRGQRLLVARRGPSVAVPTVGVCRNRCPPAPAGCGPTSSGSRTPSSSSSRPRWLPPGARRPPLAPRTLQAPR